MLKTIRKSLNLEQKAGLTTERSGILENLEYAAFNLLMKYSCKFLYLSVTELRRVAESEVS